MYGVLDTVANRLDPIVFGIRMCVWYPDRP